MAVECLVSSREEMLATPESVSVIGLGKLGLPFAAFLASKKVSVHAYDKNDAARFALDEPGLETMVRASEVHLHWAKDLSEAVVASHITFVVVPTPSGPTGEFSIDAVENVFRDLGKALQNKSDYHLVVLCSTVSPGAFSSRLKKILEQSSLREIGKNLGYCYQPLFIALGSVLRDLRKPDFVLIGQSDADAGGILSRFYEAIYQNSVPIMQVTVEEAELAKLAINVFVTMKISYANFLAHLCESVPGADPDRVSAVIGKDTRIGPKYLKAGTAFGGPCFPRDVVALSAYAQRVGVSSTLPDTARALNEEEKDGLLKKVKHHLSPPQGRVSILGIAYKQNTSVCEGSVGLYLAENLRSSGHKVRTYDPSLKNDSSLDECVKDCDVLVVTTDCPEFQRAGVLIADSSLRPKTVIDCWRIFKGEPWTRDLNYIASGFHQP